MQPTGRQEACAQHLKIFPWKLLEEVPLVSNSRALLFQFSSGRSVLDQCCISAKCRAGAHSSASNGLSLNNKTSKCNSRCHKVPGNTSETVRGYTRSHCLALQGSGTGLIPFSYARSFREDFLQPQNKHCRGFASILKLPKGKF